jgi:hypothetical protein
MSAPRNETAVPCNETTVPCNETACLLCGAPIKIARTGRPPSFCSTRHRVRYHRLRKGPSGRRVGIESANIRAMVSTPPERGADERGQALRTLIDCLDELSLSGSAAQLRHLADSAEDLSMPFDAIDESAWALEGVGDAENILTGLVYDHRPTLERIAELADLADDIDQLRGDLRKARAVHDELDWAIDDLLDPDDGP